MNGEGKGQPGEAASDPAAGPPPAGRASAWIRPALWAGAVTALVIGLWLGLPPGAPPVPPQPSPPVAPADTSGDRAVVEALHQAGDEKSRWVDEIPGADLSGLDSTRRAYFVATANARDCTCGCGYKLAACRVYDLTCPKSGPRVDALLDSLRAARRSGARAAAGSG